MRIVVLDGHTVNPGDNPWDALARFGELVVYDRTAEVEIVARAEGAEIVLTNKTPLRAETLAGLPRLQFICELATGYDNVDLVAAGERGIPVANIPAYSTDSVAQHTMALLLELCNRTGEHGRAVANGEWCRCADFSFWQGPLVELTGRKFGIIGCGRIGRRVAGLAHALGMEILAHNPRHRDSDGSPPLSWLEVAEIFATADVVSLHCPVTAENRGFVNQALLKTIKPDALLINTARGALVNEPDLARALNDGTIAGAGLDVLAEEPPRPDNPLLTARNCLITPHIAWATLASRRRLMVTAAANVSAFLRGERLNVVNGAYLQRPAPTEGTVSP
jgi:glycerate dehydrogenase